MNWPRILLIGILGLVAVMVITAAIHLVAPYVAAVTVIAFMVWIFTRGKSARDQDE